MAAIDLNKDHYCNDVHSRLNCTPQRAILRPRDPAGVRAALKYSRERRLPLAIAGGRHAMGGQQFASGGVLLDMSACDRVLAYDAERGLLRAQAGIQWPALFAFLRRQHAVDGYGWGIRQKQTGADRFSLGGALSANIHGRGLSMAPFVDDVGACTVLLADGERVSVDRRREPELFAHVAGGYGLFAVIEDITLRLVPRHKLERIVELLDIEALPDAVAQRIANGYTYGDFQFAIDPASRDFLRHGVFSCYRPVSDERPVLAPRQLSEGDWRALIALAHCDKSAAFRRYADFYLASSGQTYWSDQHQLTTYVDDYHQALDAACGHAGSEMISELYVPRERLLEFMAVVAEDFRRHAVEPIYGTVRWIERDSETALAWARQPWACIVFNLHVKHSATGLAKARADFRRLIETALALGGSYYLTYHRYADRGQLESAYPQLGDFVATKRRYDPEDLLASDWYRATLDLLDLAHS